MTKSLFLLFIFLNSLCVSAQTLILQQFKGTIQYSSNGKTNWKNCQLNQDVSGFIRLAEGASCILGKDGKSIFWKKKGDFAISELSRELLGYNSDAAAVLWEQVTHHESQKKNAIGGVYRGSGISNGTLADSSFVPTDVYLQLRFENPNALSYYFKLKAKHAQSQLDTLMVTRNDYVTYKFSTEGIYQWSVRSNDTIKDPSTQTLFVISNEEYGKKLERYENYLSALSNIDEELKLEMIDWYLEVFRLGHFPR
jgi:hypothetical protein